MVVTRKCGRGKTYRTAYTRKLKNGTRVRVAGRCIRSTTPYTSPMKTSRIRFRGYKKSARTLRSCPAGFIKRASYVRYTKKGKHSFVPEQCIRDVGAPGKGLASGQPGIGRLRQGELAKHGYTAIKTLGITARHSALAKAVAEFGSLTVWRKLNALHVYTRRLSPETSRIVKSDMNWIRTKYGIKAF